jgi:hypothetical protein
MKPTLEVYWQSNAWVIDTRVLVFGEDVLLCNSLGLLAHEPFVGDAGMVFWEGAASFKENFFSAGSGSRSAWCGFVALCKIQSVMVAGGG